MKFHGVEIDVSGLAMLITALTAAYSAYRGGKQRQKHREKVGTETKVLPKEEDGKTGDEDD